MVKMPKTEDDREESRSEEKLQIDLACVCLEQLTAVWKAFQVAKEIGDKRILPQRSPLTSPVSTEHKSVGISAFSVLVITN